MCIHNVYPTLVEDPLLSAPLLYVCAADVRNIKAPKLVLCLHWAARSLSFLGLVLCCVVLYCVVDIIKSWYAQKITITKYFDTQASSLFTLGSTKLVFSWFCVVLCCVVLYCIVLYCIVLWTLLRVGMHKKYLSQSILMKLRWAKDHCRHYKSRSYRYTLAPN
jgi:hypothetical protein